MIRGGGVKPKTALSQNEKISSDLNGLEAGIGGTEDALPKGEVIMDFREWKLELTIVASAVLLLFAMFGLFRTISPASQLETKAIVYEMPRPASSELEADFDLANREITREYLKSQTKGAAHDNKPVAKIPPKAAAKNDKKKDAQKTAQAAKPQLKINIIAASAKQGLSPSDRSQAPKFATNNHNTQKNATNTDPNAEPKKEDDKKVMTIAEWRQLLLLQPSLANVNKFLAAYRAKEVSPQDYYQVSQELVVSEKPENQAAGLYALQAAPSATSFTIVAKNLTKLTAENRATGQQVLLSYSQPARVGYLSQVLESTDPEVVKQAADTITYGLAQVKKGHAPQDSRSVRSDETASATTNLQSYGRFLQVFENWQQSGDQTLMGLAQNFLTTWNS